MRCGEWDLTVRGLTVNVKLPEVLAARHFAQQVNRLLYKVPRVISN